MDFNDRHQRDIFFQVHSDLPREGPGSREATEQAFSFIELPDFPHILDIGCGPGAQTIDLAALAPTARIEAVDLWPASVKEARRRAADSGYTDRVTISQGDMKALSYTPESFDLVWCEGAAYIMGVAVALSEWRKFIKPGGYLAFTENVWLQHDVPEKVHHWWMSRYPDMSPPEACRTLAERAGYTVLGEFVLPETAWWPEYYLPMKARIEFLRTRYQGDAKALSVLDECMEEIDIYRAFSDYYSYAFFHSETGPEQENRPARKCRSVRKNIHIKNEFNSRFLSLSLDFFKFFFYNRLSLLSFTGISKLLQQGYKFH